MAKPLKSQWSFGELFPSDTYRRVISVSELTASVRRVLEGQIGAVWVIGEISNFRLQSSGHAYFSLKDAGAQVSCVLFRDDVRSVRRELLQDGQKVTIGGEVTVYEARGQYQLRVNAIELQGVGALQAAFEKLKQKLAAEGLFAQERKRSLPRFPQRIGIVTSPTGAALRDIFHVIERRDPSLEVVVAGCRVQGQGSAAELACAIRLLNDWSARCGAMGERPVDLILLTRGGGSLEDLWAFNEEEVARAIFESRVPVVSAVGHEIDFTISDFVADVRAATPSAAAEIITEGVFSSREFVADATRQLRRRMHQQLEGRSGQMDQLAARLLRVHPRRRLQDHAQRLDDLQAALGRCLRAGLRERQGSFGALVQRLSRLKPANWLTERGTRVEGLRERLRAALEAQFKEKRTRLKEMELRLRLLSPSQILERGYSITMDAQTGRVIRSAEEVQPGQILHTRLGRGQVQSQAGEPLPDPKAKCPPETDSSGRG